MSEIEKLKKEIKFDAKDFGGFGIKSVAILKAFQDIALEHANLLKIGIEDIKQKDLLWVALKIKFEIVKQPKPDEVLTIETYPSATNMMEYFREYMIFDKSGNLLVKGVSKWCMISRTTRHISLMTKLFPLSTNQNTLFEGRLFKMEVFEPEFLADYTYQILPCDIDSNNHVNNTVYAKIIDNMLALEHHNLKHFEIDFLKETFLGQRLDMFKKRENNQLKIIGKICEDKPNFNVLLEFEN